MLVKATQSVQQKSETVDSKKADIKRDLISQRTKGVLRYKKEYGIKLRNRRAWANQSSTHSARKLRFCPSTVRRRNLFTQIRRNRSVGFQLDEEKQFKIECEKFRRINNFSLSR